MFGWGKRSQEHRLVIGDQPPLLLAKNETVLNGALRHGVAFPHSCKVGGCAACKCKLVSGQVRELTDKSYLLSREEIRDNFILGCQSIPLSDVTVVLPVNPLANQYTTGVITRQTPLTHDIAEVFLTLDDAIRYRPGQHASLRPLNNDIPARCYSFAHRCNEDGNREISFFVRRVPNGRFSNWLLDPAALQQRVAVEASLGDFHLRPGDSALVCMAGGSGLSPLISLLEGACDTDAVNRPVFLLMGARRQRDLYYTDEIRALQQRWRASFAFIPVLSEEPADSDWDGLRGWVTDALTPEMTRNAQGYLCGPPPMIDVAIECMTALGMDREALFFDKFSDQTAR